MVDKLKVDPEFEALCPPLTPEEMNLLEHNIVKDGCLEPLAIWVNGSTTILDGHNRHRICTQLGIEFKTKAIEVKDRNDAINWIIAKQLGRRNLTDEQKSYLRGKRHCVENAGLCRIPVHQNDGQLRGKTSQRLAEEYGVSSATIERDARFAKAVDKLAPEDKASVLNGTSGLSHTEVREGKRPGDAKAPTLRSARRQQRAKEKAIDTAAASAAIASQSIDDIAKPNQKRLVALCESVKRLASLVDTLLADEKSILSAAEREHWTQHIKTRVRADLAAIKRDLSRIDGFLK